MCGRYGSTEEANRWLAVHCRCPAGVPMPVGDIHPGESAPVMVAGSPTPLIVPMKWGIRKQGKLIINARKETILEKPLFENGMHRRRCLLPAALFYEWDSLKHKVVFRGPASALLFFAGIYREESDGGHFVILTAPADDSVKPVHDRMPLRIPEARIGAWLSDEEEALKLLEQPSAPVLREQAAEQLSLWDG